MMDKLPYELVAAIAECLPSIVDINSFGATCKTAYKISRETRASVPPMCDDDSAMGKALFQPYPHFLVAVSAGKLANWAVKSKENEQKLNQHIESGGLHGLASLSIEVTSMSYGEYLWYRQIMKEIIKPTSMFLTTHANYEWNRPDWFVTKEKKDRDHYPGFMPRYPLVHVDLLLLNHWIYCDLFWHTFEANYRTCGDGYALLDDETRYRFLNFCLPDKETNHFNVTKSTFQRAEEPYTDKNFQEYWKSRFMGLQNALYLTLTKYMFAENYEARYPMYRRKGNYLRGTFHVLMQNAIRHKPLLAYKIILSWTTEDEEMVNEIQDVAFSQKTVAYWVHSEDIETFGPRNVVNFNTDYCVLKQYSSENSEVDYIGVGDGNDDSNEHNDHTGGSGD